MTASTIAALLAELARELPDDLPGHERILAEVEDHLAESVERLTVDGLTRAAAERRRLDVRGHFQISAFGSLALVPIGAAGVLATLQIGQATGDYEWYGAGIGLALIAQGLLAAWLLRARRRAAS